MECDEDKKYMEISHLLDGYFMVFQKKIIIK